MGIPIPGATREQYEATKTEAGGRPFPFVPKTWTNYTAKVDEVTLQADQNGNGNDQMVIRASNGGYAVRLYISLDPSQVGPNCTDRDKAVQGNLDRLLKAGKALDVIVAGPRGVEIEPKRFPQATGKIISFGISGAVNQDGSQKMNQKGYPVPNTSLNGTVPALLPVTEPSGFQADKPAAQQTGQRTGTTPDQIPF